MAKKSGKTFRVSGRVIDLASRRGVAGLRVEAWDKDLIIDELVGSAVTDEQGTFHIKFDESYFKELFLDRRPDLYFKVFSAGALIKNTEDSVLWNVETEETEVTIEVDAPVAEKAKSLIVRGQVRQADGRVLIGGIVRAFDKDLP